MAVWAPSPGAIMTAPDVWLARDSTYPVIVSGGSSGRCVQHNTRYEAPDYRTRASGWKIFHGHHALNVAYVDHKN